MAYLRTLGYGVHNGGVWNMEQPIVISRTGVDWSDDNKLYRVYMMQQSLTGRNVRYDEYRLRASMYGDHEIALVQAPSPLFAAVAGFLIGHLKARNYSKSFDVYYNYLRSGKWFIKNMRNAPAGSKAEICV